MNICGQIDSKLLANIISASTRVRFRCQTIQVQDRVNFAK